MAAAATDPAAPDRFAPVPVDLVRRMICFLGYDHLFGCAPEPFYRGCVVRRVVHLRTVCKFFLKALWKKQQYKLLELLGEEMGDSSVEERVVSASLRTVPEAMRAGVEALFELFAIFAEATTPPARSTHALPRTTYNL